MIEDDEPLGLPFEDPERDEDDELASEQPTQSASDRRTLRRQAELSELEHENAVRFWKRVLADPIGRKEIWKLLMTAHTFEERFACGPSGFPQVEATWFHAGEQAFGLRFYQSLMQMDREGVFLMHDEMDRRFKANLKVKKSSKR